MSDPRRMTDPELGGPPEKTSGLADAPHPDTYAQETRPQGGFADLPLRPHYGGSSDLLRRFYVPVLQWAVRYDRVAGYFASSAFLSAAAGVARFASNQGNMRLLVGAQLTEADRNALLGQASLDAVLSQRLTADVNFLEDALKRRRWEVIAWLVAQGRLQIRVGVPVGNDGVPLPASDPAAERYFHSKWGVLQDTAGDQIVFHGSINESRSGWTENYETFDVHASWWASWKSHGQHRIEEFERLWQGRNVDGWKSVPLPEAVEHNLLRLLPPEDDWIPEPNDPLEPTPPPPLTESEHDLLVAIRDAPLSRSGVGLVSSGIRPWAHQTAISRRIVDTWPRSYLLADEVGLGKTIEVGLVLRELLLSGTASTALLLVPASLLTQWQEELSEKLLLHAPRLDLNGRKLCWVNGQTTDISPGQNPWRASPVLLASSHLARRRRHRSSLLDGEAWDLVFVDEIHHARRRGSKQDDPPNQLLSTLIELERNNMWRALLAASATPMQLHTHDLWDVLKLMGLPELWSDRADRMEDYYKELLQPFAVREWSFLQKMLAAQIGFAEPDETLETTKQSLDEKLGPVGADRLFNFHSEGIDRSAFGGFSPRDQECWNKWLRANTPVRDRVFRTTRATLRSYAEEGLLSPGMSIPVRDVNDQFCDLGDAAALYDRIENYIRRYYDAYLKHGKRTHLGFVMTIYRRRLTSSFYAVKRSLQRRLESLRNRRSALADLLDDDDEHTLEASSDLEDASLHGGTDDLQAEIAELEGFVNDLSDRPPDEPKMELLHRLLRESFDRGHRTAVVFTQYTDTLDYIREQLLPTYGEGVLCYSGRGGERWDTELSSWSPLPKERVKELFRRGEGKILLGTDSMSEGLNLQTCARLFNFDLPWNFMRLEQRIGRIDRIGGRAEVYVTNFFYKGTVEEDIYTRIADRHDWFKHVVGNAQPVLAATEALFEQAAMGKRTASDSADEFSRMIDLLQKASLKMENLDSVPRQREELSPVMDLPGLKENLLSVRVVRKRLKEHPEFDDAWLLTLGGKRHGVTFEQSVYQDKPGLSLLSWGNALLDALIEEALSGH